MAESVSLLSICVGFFDLESESNNKHNLRVLRALTINMALVSTHELLETRLPEQLCDVMTYAVENYVEAFYEL